MNPSRTLTEEATHVVDAEFEALKQKGKSRPLGQLPDAVQDRVKCGDVSESQARTLQPWINRPDVIARMVEFLDCHFVLVDGPICQQKWDAYLLDAVKMNAHL